MSSRRILSISSCTLGLLALALPSYADEPPASRHLPDSPLLVLELRGMPRALRALAAHEGWQRAWSAALELSPDGGAGIAKLAPVLRALERASGDSSLAALGDLVGERALLWLEEPARWVAEITPEDPRRVAQFLLELDRALALIPGAPDLESFTCDGAPGWSLGESIHLVRAGDAFLVGAERPLIVRALQRGKQDRRAGAPQPLQTVPAAPADGATLWFDGNYVKSADGISKLPEQLREPLAGLLLGSYLAPLWNVRALRVDLGWNADMSKLHFEAVGGDARELELYWRELVAPAEPSMALPSFASAPGFLARIRLQRDWARWWREKNERWSDAGRAGIRDLEQLLALLLKGEDFADALADVEGPVELFLIEPRFDDGAGPAHRYPAGALVLGLAQAERGEIFERGFRTLLGISNGERVKRGFSTLRATAGEEEGFRVVRTAWEADAPELQRVEGNLSPGFARCAHCVVIASSSQALDAALAVLRSAPHEGDEDPARAAPRCEVLEIDGSALARLLEANREALVFARALEDGEELATAERRIDALLDLARSFAGAAAHFELTADRTRATLDLELAGRTR